MIHMPDGAAKAVVQPCPRNPGDPLVVTAMCVCGDPYCGFTAATMTEWVWTKWQGGLPSYASAPGWIDDTDPRYAKVLT